MDRDAVPPPENSTQPVLTDVVGAVPHRVGRDKLQEVCWSVCQGVNYDIPVSQLCMYCGGKTEPATSVGEGSLKMYK